jgi:predicted transposase YbfD/YdcC
VAENSNEIVVIPKLLEMMAIEGAIVTIGAMWYRREIAKKITEK